MRFGICCPLDKAEDALAIGYDYVELPAGQTFLVDLVPPERIQAAKAEATNLFAIGNLNLTEANEENRHYAESLIPAVAAAGIEIMVVGSGAARKAKEGQDIEQAQEGFADACGVFSQIAGRYGITLAPESLKREETNVGNSLGDLASRLGKRGVAFTVDSHHLLHDWHDLGNADRPTDEFWAKEIPSKPAHVHMSAFDRRWRVDDGSLIGFVKRLRELGYDGRVSLECEWQDWSSEIGPALDEARGLFQSV